MRRLAVLGVAVALTVTACGGPILANPPAQGPVPTSPPDVTPQPARDPQPVVLPRDDGSHRRLTEWWYYTGHLVDTGGGRWGFEYVIFRAERGRFPVSWASHLALTDEANDRHTYAQRNEVGPQVDLGPGSSSLDLALVPPGGGTRDDVGAWNMLGLEGQAGLFASTVPGDVAGGGSAIAVSVELEALTRPVLHDGDGWIDFGPAGGSYYYSRTRMSAEGVIFANGSSYDVTGTAWFDHQWGDFIAVGAGGWDWFAVNLDDGTDLMLYLIRDRDGGYPLVSGTLVAPDGAARNLSRDAFSVDVTGRWQSPNTGTDYPAGWQIEIPGEGLVIDLTPTVADQELDTRATTGVVYWEGSQVVRARRDGVALGGEAYVELTGYAPAETAPPD